MYNRKDAYYLKAKKEGYRSRASYKLIELNKKYRFLRSSCTVLDCGAFPGGWSQVALENVKYGRVIAVDIVPLLPFKHKNFFFIKGNMNDQSTINSIISMSSGRFIDVMLSDMAPKTTGIAYADHFACLELANSAYKLAESVLVTGGTFLTKLFDGDGREGFVLDLKKSFGAVKIIRPDSTRKSSFELYILCSNYSPN